MGLGRKRQARARAAYLTRRCTSHRKLMSGAPVGLRPGHQRQDLLAKESFTAACRRLAYKARQRLFRRELSTEH